MNRELDERYDPRTYYDYLKLKDVNTKPFLMIAELIDNSISSFEGHFKGKTWDRVLEIDIEIGFNGNEKDIFGYKTISGSFISVKDNAFGINPKDLIGAVKLNSKNVKATTLNVHGRGLKQSAFFFGVDLTVLTTYEGKGQTVELKLSDQEEGDNSVIFINPKDIKRSEAGTEILIQNINSDKVFSSSIWDNIKLALEYRYIKYLTSGKVEIRYNFNKEVIGKFNSETKEPKTAVASSFEVFEKYDNIEDFIKIVDKEVKSDITKRGDNVDRVISKQAFETIANIFRDADKDRQKIFEWTMVFDILGNKLDVNFWMLPSSHVKYRGIRLFEGLRAINHYGYQNQETRPYTDWKINGMETGSTENRFAGQADLSQIKVTSKTDKSSFTISEEQRMLLDKAIYSVWAVFNKFVLRSRNDKKFKKGKKISRSETEAMKSISATKFPNKNITYEGDEISKNIYAKFTYESTGEEIWDIRIKVDDSRRPINIFDHNMDQDSYVMEIVAYSAHPFWRDIDKLKSDFLTEALVPITLLIAIQSIESTAKDSADPVDLANIGGRMFNNE